MLDELNRINLLFDIYGKLLTERQQEVLRLYFSDDFSLGEIAAGLGVTRQAVHDLIRRALGAIEAFDRKLGLYELFHSRQELLHEAERIVTKSCIDPEDRARLRVIIRELRRENER